MKYEWIDGFLMAKKGVNKDFKEAGNWNFLYSIKGEIIMENFIKKTARGFDTVDCNRCRTVCPMRFGTTKKES